MNLPRPSLAVLAVLEKALEAERHQYVRKGGGRDFKHEEEQDAAVQWVACVRILTEHTE